MAELWLSPVGVTAVSDDDKERAFLSWCRRNDQVAFPSCSIAAVPTSGRSVIATEPISEGDVVVEVKDAAVLMAESSCIADDLARARLTKDAQQRAGGGGDDDDDADDADDNPASSPSSSSSSSDALLEVQALILALMAEKLRGADSPWHAYIDFFPASARELGGMPLFWSRRQRRRLRGTAAADKTRGRLQHPADAPTRVGELWRDVALPFVLEGSPRLRRMLGLGDDAEEEEEEEQPGAPPSSSSLPLPMAARVRAARRLYRWATAVVASYSFVLGDDRYQALVPAWDALNHVSGRRNVRLAHDAASGALRMVATRAIAAGEEVVNRYGPLSTSELLRGYGFVERGNPHAHAQVPAQFALRAAVAAAGAVGGGGVAGAASGGKRGRTGRRRQQDEDHDDAEAAPPEAWAALGEELALVDSDADVDLDLEEEEEEEDDDDQSCSDADSGGGEESGAASEDESGEEEAADGTPLPSLEQAQRRAPSWPLVFCAARALRLLPRGGAFRVPGVPEAEDDEERGGGGGGPPPPAAALAATGAEQRRLLARLASKADESDGDDGAATGWEGAERYAAARRAARPRFPDTLAAFALLCLHATQPSPAPPAPANKRRRRRGGRKDDDEDEDAPPPRPPPGVGAVASHLRALARRPLGGDDDDGGGGGAPAAPDPLRTARALASSPGVTPEALRAACLGALAAMRARYRGGGLERDRRRAAALAGLAPRRAAALMARLEEQEALERARQELLGEGGKVLMKRACAAVWVGLVRRGEVARKAAEEEEAEEDDEEEEEEDDEEEEEEDDAGACGKEACGHHHHHHHQKKKKQDEGAGFAFHFDVAS